MTSKHESDSVADGPADTANPYSKRLEYVRKEVAKIENVRDFWRALGYEQLSVDDPDFVSYESARRYHTDRTPPVDYLVRVADRFPDATLQFLATGRRPETSDGTAANQFLATAQRPESPTAGMDADEAGRRMLQEPLTALARLFPPAAVVSSVRWTLLRVVDQIWQARYPVLSAKTNGSPPDAKLEVWVKSRVESAEAIGRHCRELMELIGVDADRCYVGQLEQFAQHFQAALDALQHDPIFGQTLAEVRAMTPEAPKAGGRVSRGARNG